MQWTVDRITTATERIRTLLDEIGLDNYVFEVEPRDGHWEVRIGRATAADHWKETTLTVDDRALDQTVDDPDVRQRIENEWSRQLSGEAA